jgi:hypothetical protein
MGSDLGRVPVIGVFIILVFISYPLAYADRGGIPITPGVSVYEPGQKAIVAWNGQEEILMLSTDVHSSQETLVLEILPLPSRPEIELSSFQAFQAIQEMIWEEGLNRYIYGTEDNARQGSVEVLFHEEIGAHNITVVMAIDPGSLVSWANTFLLSSSVNQNITLGNLQAVVQDYVSRGFRYFALDLVTFVPQEKSVDPILYRFNSSLLYYPLLITSPIGGDGNITLFTLTKEKLEPPIWPPNLAYYQTSHGPLQPIQFTLSTGELAKIDLRLSELLPDGAWLSVLTYRGNLSFLDRDLMIAEEDLNPPTDQATTVAITLPSDTLVLCFLLGAASALAGVAVTFLIIRVRAKDGTGKGK